MAFTQHEHPRLPLRPRYPDEIPASSQEWGALIRQLTARDRQVNEALSIIELEGDFAIDSTGLKTITVRFLRSCL